MMNYYRHCEGLGEEKWGDKPVAISLTGRTL